MFAAPRRIRPGRGCGVRDRGATKIRRKTARKGKGSVRVQYGALPYRFTPEAALEILILTTRRTRRWIVPKGWPIKGLRPPKAAAREAFEEAGVTGRIGVKPVGSFTYDKALDEEGHEVSCEVTVYPLLVKRQAKTWPEFEQRLTQWVEPGRAAAMVADHELKTLIAAFAKRVAAVASNLSV
ncbi:MAG TPA: NUDIX hydrolase [Roseiarcus sp.]|nr:NUDIX hydrolase [Roseiarcus sp.]